MPTTNVWRLVLLDGVQLFRPNGDVVRLGRKAQALLAWLAAQRSRSGRRETAAGLLWPNVDDLQARASLRQALSALRKIQGSDPPFLASDETTVALTGSVDVDLWRFEELADSGGGDLPAAAEVYRSDLMSGFSLPESGGFNDWLAVEQARWRRKAAAVLARLLTEACEERRPVDEGVQAALRLLEFEPFNETAHRALMLFYSRQGRSGEALKQFRELTELLRRELQAAPEEATLQLARRLRLDRRLAAVAAPSPAPSPEPVGAPPATTDPRPAPRRRLAPVVVAGALLLLGAAALTALLLRLVSEAAPATLGSVRRIVDDGGLAVRPALSPDGRHVAYAVWEGDRRGLYVADFDGGAAPIQLAAIDGLVDYPAWRRDGGAVAFVRTRRDAPCEILVRPFPTGEVAAVGECPSVMANGLTWSADSQALYLSAAAASGPDQIYRLDVLSGALTPVSRPPADVVGDWDPIMSWDGRKLAFRRQLNGAASRLMTLDLRTGAEQVVVGEGQPLWGQGWTSDDRHLVYSAGTEGDAAIWRVDARGRGPAVRLSPGLLQYVRLTTARDTPAIAFEGLEHRRNLMTVAPGRGPVPAFGDDRDIRAVAQSAVGDRAVVVRHLGQDQLWLHPAAGAPRQLAPIPGAKFSDPAWSPDGRRLAYICTRDDQPDLCVLDLASGREVNLTRDDAIDHGPSWSADGSEIYFGSRRGDQQWRVWRIAASGRGEARPITPAGIRIARPAPDGRHLYYARVDRSGLWRGRLGADGLTGEGTLVVRDLSLSDECNWILDGERIIYVARPHGAPDAEVRRLDPGRGAAVTLASVPSLAFDHAIQSAGGDSLLALTEFRSVHLIGARLEGR